MDGGTTTIVNDSALTLSGNVNGTLTASAPSVTVSTFEGKNVSLTTAGAVTATGLEVDVLQVSAGTGINVSSEGVDHLLHKLPVEILPWSMLVVMQFQICPPWMVYPLPQSCLEYSSQILHPQEKSLLIAQSPITINAPVNAGSGSVLVAASGSASTDDVTINSQITAASADIYAGDSVSLGSSASVVSSDAEIAVGTNYNPVTATTSSGTGSGTIGFSSASVLNGVTQ